jgi:peptidoglycan/LPS O-acetylase OafA/YrhL
MQATNTSNRSVLLDITRLVAVLLIIVGHIFQSLSNPFPSFLPLYGIYPINMGGIGVTLFIIVSGISLQLNYGMLQLNYKDFILRRLVRLYPVYWMVLVIGILVYLIRFTTHTNNYLPVVPEWTLSIGNILLTITGLHSLFGQWGGSFVLTSWFIGVILVLYLLFPILSKCIKLYPTTSILTLLAISVVSRWILAQNIILLPYRPIDWFPLCRIFEFGLGIYLVCIIGKGFWFKFNLNYQIIDNFISRMGELSFPLFLMHWPFIFLIPLFVSIGINVILIIGLFFLWVILLSWLVYLIDRHIQRQFRNYPLKQHQA